MVVSYEFSLCLLTLKFMETIMQISINIKSIYGNYSATGIYDRFTNYKKEEAWF